LAGLLDDDAQPFSPHALPTLALTATEIGVLDRLVNDKPKARQKTLELCGILGDEAIRRRGLPVLR
jgi:hypothetical protein